MNAKQWYQLNNLSSSHFLQAQPHPLTPIYISTTPITPTMEGSATYDESMDLNMKATELRLGLPGTEEPARNIKKRPLTETTSECGSKNTPDQTPPPPAKSQIVGWPPVRSYRKNNSIIKKSTEEGCGIFVKVSMDGAPYLRKIDLKLYQNYPELLKALEDMFKFRVGQYSEREGYKGSEYAPTYQDKDGDWMLVGDVPWDMFASSCNKLRIMKGSEAKGLSS